MLARKPSPAASQYFRTWSQKISMQISGDCTPALGHCFWWLISWDWHNYLLETSRFVDGLLNVSKGIKRRELWDWSGSVCWNNVCPLSCMACLTYDESHTREICRPWSCFWELLRCICNFLLELRIQMFIGHRQFCALLIVVQQCCCWILVDLTMQVIKQ